MPTLTLEKVYSRLSSRVITTNKKLTKITKTLKMHDEVLKFLSRKQFETDDRFDDVDDRFDGIDRKLESMERSLTLLNSLPTLHELTHQILRQLTEMRNEQSHTFLKIQNHEQRISILEKNKHQST